MVYELNKKDYIGKYFGMQAGYFLTFDLQSQKYYSLNEVKELLNSCYGAQRGDIFGKILNISLNKSFGLNNELFIQIELLYETLGPIGKEKRIIYISWENKDKIILGDTENEMFDAFRLAKEVDYGN